MEVSELDYLFKLPQISTRSQTKLKLNKIKSIPENNQGFIVKEISSTKRITRSASKGCLQTNILTVKSTLVACKPKNKFFNDLGNCSDSGYNTNGSYNSRDCESVGSRDSAFSEMCKSLDTLHTDDNFSECAVSPPDSYRQFISPADGATTQSIAESDLKIIALKEGNVKLLVPTRNLNNYKGCFQLKVDSTSQTVQGQLNSDMRVHHMSPVVSLKPHGIKFSDNEPGILVIPLRFEPRNETWLSAFYSDTSSCSEPSWQRLPRSDFYIKNGYMVIFLRHFSLFTVIEEEPFPEIMKRIRCRTGGRLRKREVPGIEVNFPRGCLENDIDACLRVLFDKEPLLGGDTKDGRKLPLASPIISLGPHGLQFNPERLPVLITLPIPEYEDIMRRCPKARLLAYQSSIPTGNGQLVWQPIDLDIQEPKVMAYRHGITGLPIPVVTFPVYHFSFFKVVWDLLSSTLYEAKMGMSYLYPYISFSMMCQAFMEESHENNRFGLEVICYRSDRKLPEATNYRHRVGASLKPKLVRPGKISVRLRSQMFEADVEAGEDVDMVKEEPDFRGRDFEKQYACRFKPDGCVERGPFGKVIVERMSARPDPLFEFNLHKTGVEAAESSPVGGCERWTVFAMKELAGSLQITEGNNWKLFAKHIGFTKSEIKNKLSYSPDPFFALMNMYNHRGGTPEEFIQALYIVSRDIRLGIAQGNSNSPGSGSSRSSRSHGSGSFGSGSHESSSPMKRFFGSFAWAQPQRDSDSANSNEQRGSSNSKKRTLPEIKNGGSTPKRRRMSNGSDRPASSSSEEREVEERRTVSTEKHKSCSRRLNDKDLWRISSGIARKDWRNLGRTLGIEEIVLGNLEHSHQSVGFRECAYQMLLEWKGRKPTKCTFGELYCALLREKMNSVAKFMVRKIPSSGGQEADSNSD